MIGEQVIEKGNGSLLTKQAIVGATFKQGLASEKHFTPQELNKLHLKTRQEGGGPKKITKEELKKQTSGNLARNADNISSLSQLSN
jgi:hypothetical protein